MFFKEVAKYQGHLWVNRSEPVIWWKHIIKQEKRQKKYEQIDKKLNKIKGYKKSKHSKKKNTGGRAPVWATKSLVKKNSRFL